MMAFHLDPFYLEPSPAPKVRSPRREPIRNEKMRQKCSRSIPQSPMPSPFGVRWRRLPLCSGQTAPSITTTPGATYPPPALPPMAIGRFYVTVLAEKFPKIIAEACWSTYQLAGAPGRPPPTASCGRPARGHRPRWRWQLCCSSSQFLR